jgi:pyridoxamine 5'-phosphate oxidase
MLLLTEVAKFLVFTMAIQKSLAFLQVLRGSRQKKSLIILKSSSSVSDLRKEYSSKGLDEDEVIKLDTPFDLFDIWLKDAIRSNVIEPNAMCLSTCQDNKPSARYVLLKGYDKRGFVWYTNYTSRKASDLSINPYAALTFWWGEMERSVRIEGKIEKVSEEESTQYFQSRPRSSQIGAWSSNQSTEISNRIALEEQEKSIVNKFASYDVIPKPPHWGGYRLIPNRIEFWKGRESRLHDRLVFEKADIDSPWKLSRLQP